MTDDAAFLFIVLISTWISVVYLITGLLHCDRKRKRRLASFDSGTITAEETTIINNEARIQHRKVWLTFVFIVLCPAAGPVYIFFGQFLGNTLFRKKVEPDALFSKEKTHSRHAANVEEEQNLVPLEEALVISDERNRRKVVMNAVKGDATNSLSAIMEALNNDDSETAHYAASILSDILNEFRANVNRMKKNLSAADGEKGQEDAAAAEAGKLVDYMYTYLRQNVFSDLEQKSFIETMEYAMNYLYAHVRRDMTVRQFRTFISLLIDEPDYKKAEVWMERMQAQYPEMPETYQCRLSLYFQQHDREGFFRTIVELKRSDIVLDSEMMELVRMFSL